MRIDKYSMAKGWMMQEDATPEEAKATWDTLETEFEEKRKAQLMASAETDKIIQTINDKFGPGTMFPASEAPIPPMTDTQAVFEWEERNRKAGGGRIPFGKGKDVKIGKNQYGEFETTYKKPTTTLDKYQIMLDDYDELVKDSLRLNDGTKLPKDIKEYVNNYTFADGTKAKYAIYSNLVARRSNPKYTKSLKPPVDVVNIKLSIMDNLIAESNAGNKATNLTTLAKKVNWTDKDISNYKRQGKIKKLETSADKVDKVYKNFFNNLDAPLEDFFNPIEKMSQETGLNRGVISTLLNKNPNYTDEGKKLFKALGTFSLKGKYAQEGFTIGQFLDDFENRLFVGENGLLSMRNYNKPTSAIVLDAYRHWKQGGKQIEWINPPKMDKQGNLISLADAQFKYTGPNSSDTIWSASGNTVNGVKSKSIAIFGKDAPEFKKVFKDYDDIFRLENEIRPHPVTGKPTKMIDISKEAYNIGKGSSFGTSNLARDHVNLIEDVFGNDPKYGTRILPRRVNEYAGALKTIEQATKKGIGKNYTQNKIDKIYEKMGYNFTKNYDQILNDEYNLAKKVFNKFQAAGWGFDQNTNRWVIKEGFDVETAKNIDARGNPKNPNKILQSPFKMVEDKEIELSKKSVNQLTDNPKLNLTDNPKLNKFIAQTTMSSGPAGAYELLMKDPVTRALINSKPFKEFQALTRGTMKTAGKAFGIGDLVLGWYDYKNNRSKGESHNVALENAYQMMTFGLWKTGDKEVQKEIRERFVKEGGNADIFDQTVALNKKHQEFQKTLNEFAEQSEWAGDKAAKSTFEGMLTNNMNDILNMQKKLSVDYGIDQAGGPITIGTSQATEDVKKAAYGYAKDRTASVIEEAALRRDPGAGVEGDPIMNMLGPGWWKKFLPQNLVLGNWAGPVTEKEKEAYRIKQLAKEDPEAFEKYLQEQGVYRSEGMNLPALINFSMRYPEYGVSFETEKKPYFDGGIASLRRKK